MNEMNKNLCIFSILLFALLFAGSAWAAENLKITELVAAPLVITSENVNFDTLRVNVLNSGAGSIDAIITLSVLEAVTNTPTGVSAEYSSTIASLGNNRWTDALALNLSLLPSGSYRLVVEAYKKDEINPSDTESVFFTVKQPPAVPELDFVLIPLLALSVLAVVFFSDRYNKKAK